MLVRVCQDIVVNDTGKCLKDKLNSLDCILNMVVNQ